MKNVPFIGELKREENRKGMFIVQVQYYTCDRDLLITRMELARAAGWQLRSCSGNNSRCPPAHLSSIRPDPIPIQFRIQSGQRLARRC